MSTNLEFDVSALDANHRQALEDLIGAPLTANQHVVIQVRDAKTELPVDPRPRQTVEDWTSIYKGLTNEEIDELDRSIKARHSV